MPFPVLALTLLAVATQEDLECLDGKGGSALGEYLLREIHAQYDARRVAVKEALASPGALKAYRKRVRAAYRSILGPLPEKTPLNARVVGTLEGDGCRIEKVVFESRPRHYVTANLYIPSKGKPPFPGVAVACGHSAHGKAYEAYQSVCVLLAKNGFVVLIYDPFGQGERRQLRGGPGNSGMQHKLCNVNSLPVGRNAVHYQMWDGVRSLDYLLSRPEVDTSKPLGMTGNSGGGAQTIHLMVMDDRIGPAAPSCHVTTIEQEFTRGAPGDGCQTAPYTGFIPIDHPDFFTMRAPKPSIILSAEKDYKDIRFTRKTFAEAKAVYEKLGAADRMDMFAFNDRHAFSKPRREAAARWMSRWLLDDPAPVVEPELKLQPRASLHVTKSGETYKEFKDMLTIPELNLKRARALEMARKEFWASRSKGDCLKEVRRLLGLRSRKDAPRSESRGTVSREGYRIEKLLITREGDVPLPALLFVPDGKDRSPATVVLDGRGKAAEAAPGGAIEKLVARGHRVLSVDLRGWGETRYPEGSSQHSKGEHTVAMWSLHLGRPLLGQRVEDVRTALGFLLAREDVDPSALHLIGTGAGGPVALHAAALDGRFDSVTLRGSIRSWVDDVVAKPLTPDAIGLVVPGSLEKYDLPDLAALLGDKLKIDPE